MNERDALREAVRAALAGNDTRAAIAAPGGHDAGLWSRLCKEIGVAGLAVPTAFGGSGASLLETHVVLEELGRGLTPSPMVNSVLAGQALLRAGDTRLLPEICAGDRVVAVAFAEDPQVVDAFGAGVFLIAEPDGSLWQAESVTVTDRPSLDLTRRTGAVTLVPGARRLGDGVRPFLDAVAWVSLSAEQVGAATRALELTLEHVRTRHQFGRAIGSFQVLQHRLAEAHVRVEAARSASWTAAEALVAGSPSAYQLAAVAKVCCSETLQAVAAEMMQMHGGMSITWEHDAHLYFRRAHASARLFGSPAHHIERLATAAGLPG